MGFGEVLRVTVPGLGFAGAYWRRFVFDYGILLGGWSKSRAAERRAAVYDPP